MKVSRINTWYGGTSDARMLTHEDLENTAPRVQSDFKPKHEDLIQGQKRKQRRRERRLKRIIAVLVGYLVMGWMIYLIMVTAKTIPKIWDPYDILGLSRVRGLSGRSQKERRANLVHVLVRR